MTARLKPQDLDRSSNTAFATTHVAFWQGGPLTEVLENDEFFLNVRNNLRPGDKVEIGRYAPGDRHTTRLLEHCAVLIAQKTAVNMRVRLLGEILYLEEADPALEAEKPVEQLEELEIVTAENGFIVRGVVTGTTHKHFKTEPAAKRYVTDYGKKAA